MYPNVIRKILTVIGVSCIPVSVLAIPAKPGLLTMRQSDGSEVEVRLVGDEHAHMYTTPEGYPLVWADGTLCYATLKGETLANSGLPYKGDAKFEKSLPVIDKHKVLGSIMANRRPSKVAADGAYPGLYTDAAFPLQGSPKALVILVEYADVKMTLSNAHDYFDRMLNQPGFADYGATGSAADFFRENSRGRFTPQFDVIGPVTLSRPRAYYGANASYGDRHPEEMVIEACQLLDDEIDFTQYDTDGDGVIDNVFVFYAGQSEAAGGGDDTVWPHSSNIAMMGNYVFDGKQLDYYACSNEWQEGRPDGVGTFVHEFSHVLGLPDLYATIESDAFTPGAWSTLDAGPYNNNGCTPPLYSAFERTALGWIEPVEVTGACNATLLPLDQGVCAVVKTTDPEEYFLLENRRRSGWDAYLPGEGMLIWHVHYDKRAWAINAVNNDAAHQRVDLVEADGIPSASTRDGDAFPGTASVTSHILKSWGGEMDALPLTDIACTADMVTFKVADGRETALKEEALAVTEVGAHSFTANWRKRPGVNYMLTVCGGEGVLDGYDGRLIGDMESYTVTGLDAATDYSYFVTGIEGLTMSLPSNKIELTTAATPLSEKRVEALEAENIVYNGFTARWAPLEGAESYDLTVYTKKATGPQSDIMAFDNGLSDLRGWITTSRMTYDMGGMAGASVPSLRLSSDHTIESPHYPDGISAISLWHRGSGTGADAKLLVEVLTPEGWRTVAEDLVGTGKGGKIFRADKMPADARRVRITALFDKGNVAVDDICIEHGTSYSISIVEGYDPLKVTDGTQCAVTGLEGNTTYYYTVTARKATELSQTSEEVEVKTALSGIDGIKGEESAFTVKIEGCSLSVGEIPSTTKVILYDVAGRVVASATGGCTLSTDIPGIYILIVGHDALKINLR